MKRRDFVVAASAIAGGSTVAVPAWAQGAPARAGTDYLALDRPAPVDSTPGKIEVVEFFSYNCPHCNTFEPRLATWLKQQSQDVAFRRVPVPFVGNDVVAKQRLYYALEAMGKVDEYTPKVFHAIHVQRENVNGDANIIAWAGRNGLDQAKFTEAFNSFGVVSRAKRASQLVDAYKVSGVPALGIAGKYYTDGQLAGNMDRALQVTDQLIAQVRKGG